MSEVLPEDVEQARHGFEMLARLFEVPLVFTEAIDEQTGYHDSYGRPLRAVVVECLAVGHSDAERLASQLRLRRLAPVHGPGGTLICWIGWLPQVSRQTPAAVRLYAPDVSSGGNAPAGDLPSVDNCLPATDVGRGPGASSDGRGDIPDRWAQSSSPATSTSPTLHAKVWAVWRTRAAAGAAEEAHPAVPVAGRLMMDAVATVLEILERVGAEKIALVTVGRQMLSIQPSQLDEGESIARALQLTGAHDYPTAVPAFTDFSGNVGVLEVHVRGALHRSAELAARAVS